MYFFSHGDSPMTQDAVNQRKRPRWFSPRGATSWILAPAVVVAAAIAVLMFWPGLVCEWRSADGAFGLVRRPASQYVSGVRGDVFVLHAKWCRIAKHWDPDGFLVGSGPITPGFLERSHDRMVLNVGNHVFRFQVVTPP